MGSRRRGARRAVAAVALALMALPPVAGPALAQDGLRVALPQLGRMSRGKAEALLAQMAQVNVVTSNCPAYAISDGEWALLTGTGDALAAQLGFDPATYDQLFFGPAFDLLADPSACDRIGPVARPLIDTLVAHGGGTQPQGEIAAPAAGVMAALPLDTLVDPTAPVAMAAPADVDRVDIGTEPEAEVEGEDEGTDAAKDDDDPDTGRGQGHGRGGKRDSDTATDSPDGN